MSDTTQGRVPASGQEPRVGPTPAATTLIDTAPAVLGHSIRVAQRADQVLLPFGETNAVVRTPPEAARPLILELEHAGIGGEHISFLHVAEDSDQQPGLYQAVPTPGYAPTPGFRDARNTVLIGAVIGALAGALIAGVIVGLVASTAAGWWAALGGAALGSALGALWAGFSRIGASDAWERSLHVTEDDTVLVGVHADDTRTIERAEPVLRRYRVWWFAKDGTPVQHDGHS